MTLSKYFSLARSSPTAVAALAAALLLAAAGCSTSREAATARYRSTQDEMVYRARAIGLGQLFESGGLGQDPRVALRGWATCPGQDCRPRQAWLSFSLERAAKEMRIVADRSIRLQADEAVYSWDQDDLGGAAAGSNAQNPMAWHSGGAPTHGELARVSFDLGALRQLGNARTVVGSIGSEEFTLSYEERAPLRALYEKASGTAAAETGS